MTKYRLRLESGKIIGPVEENQIFFLNQNGRITGDEEVQVYPTGKWLPIKSFDFYQKIQDSNKTIQLEQKNKEKTKSFVINLNKLEELKSRKIPNLKVDLKQAPDAPRAEKSLDQKTKANQEVVTQKNIKSRNLMSTDLKKNEDFDSDEKIKDKEKTQVLSISTEQIMLSAVKYEKELIKTNQIENPKKTVNENPGKHIYEGEKKPKKKIFAVLGIFLLFLAFLFPAEKKEKNKFQLMSPKIIFPIIFDTLDEKKSADLFNSGIHLFERGTFSDLITAGVKFKDSYQNNENNHDALSMMVRSYSEQLIYSNDFLKDSQVLFSIIQGKKPFLVQNVNGVIGLNLFYRSLNKIDAAVDVVEKYLKLKSNQITQDLFAVYLESLIQQGKLERSKQFFQALEKETEKNKYAYLSLINYLKLNQKNEEALKYIDEGISKYPYLPHFYLLKTEMSLKNKDLNLSLSLLNKAENLGLDSNKISLAKYYELKGLIFVLKNKSKEAAKLFQKSLNLADSDSLRSKLAELESSKDGKSIADNIINESKAMRHLSQAEDFFKGNSYELALSAASKATDVFPGHIPSELFLSKVQFKLGLTQQALKTLEDLVNLYPSNMEIKLELIKLYIESYKTNEAKNLLQTISKEDVSKTWIFSSISSKLFLKQGDLARAVSQLNNSISLNPLNDKDTFILASILIKKSNFESARILLNKCIELDPSNADYRISYARLLYETQDDQAALGYLLSLKDTFGSNPKILSEMAILSYKSGRVKDFLDYKKMLEENHFTDKSLYEFLIKAAIIDDRSKDVPPLVEKLISIEPGDYEHMMLAGQILFQEGKFKESAKWFLRVKEKLPTYPKVLYYMAKLEYFSGDANSALKKLEEDIKINGENDLDLTLMAEIYMAQGKLVEAERFLRKAQKINPNSFDATVGLADLNVKTSNFDLALELYRRAIKMKASESILHKKIGDVYRQLGQGVLAIESYKLYLEMEPESVHKNEIEQYINLMK